MSEKMSRKTKMNKKAAILHETVIFVVLNLIFLSMMILFIQMKGSSVHIAEEETAKQIALLIDRARPGTDIEVYLKDFFEKAESKGMSRDRTIRIDNDNNVVMVKGSEDTAYDYAYFNNVNVKFNFQGDYLILEVV